MFACRSVPDPLTIGSYRLNGENRAASFNITEIIYIVNIIIVIFLNICSNAIVIIDVYLKYVIVSLIFWLNIIIYVSVFVFSCKNLNKSRKNFTKIFTFRILYFINFNLLRKV